jgi:hypothetical protein
MKQLLMAVLLMGAGTACAEWTKLAVSSKAEDAFTLYIDIATIQRNGKLVRIWDLQDFKLAQTVDGQQYLSEKTQIEFDCEARKARVLSIIDTAGPMGTGKVAYSDGDVSDWTAVAANTLGEAEMKVACAPR